MTPWKLKKKKIQEHITCERYENFSWSFPEWYLTINFLAERSSTKYFTEGEYIYHPARGEGFLLNKYDQWNKWGKY